MKIYKSVVLIVSASFVLDFFVTTTPCFGDSVMTNRNHVLTGPFVDNEELNNIVYENRPGRADAELELLARSKSGDEDAQLILGIAKMNSFDPVVNEAGVKVLSDLAHKGKLKSDLACYWLAHHYVNGSANLTTRRDLAVYFYKKGMLLESDFACAEKYYIYVYIGHFPGDFRAASDWLSDYVRRNPGQHSDIESLLERKGTEFREVLRHYKAPLTLLYDKKRTGYIIKVP